MAIDFIQVHRMDSANIDAITRNCNIEFETVKFNIMLMIDGNP